MVHIEIEVPRPFLTLTLVLGAVGFLVWSTQGDVTQAVGGTPEQNAQVVHSAEEDVKRVRLEQQVLNRREDILRTELAVLEQEEEKNTDPHTEYELDQLRESLISLIQDQHAAEQEILESLRQIWEAQGYAMQASHRSQPGDGTINLTWPVEPDLGISAHFEDSAYEARFGIPHHAIDIPVAQGSPVHAAADGTVVSVKDNGLGFNSLVIEHEGGFATMYGHVSEFLVREGDVVSAGDIVALSGGRPGTPGAGRLTTGSHLHFELSKDGKQVDPEQYLSRW